MSSQSDTMNGQAGALDLGLGAQSGAASFVTDTTTATFREDVLAESTKQPVLVDFWAPWCGPCKQLGPLIEKVVKAAGGKVKLAKMDIDSHPEIAGQLGIQSIPAVIAFSNGQPVDGFVGALPESQIKGFIERLVGPLGPAAVDETLAQAEQHAAEGDATAAAALYAEVLAEEPDNSKALGGLARLHVGLGELEQARALLDSVPEAKAADAAIAGARAALELASQTQGLGDIADLERRIAADQKDHQARFDLALALAARERRADAVDQLIEIIRRDRTWHEDGARKQLLQFFEAWGPQDDATVDGRRRLSTVLFS
jgi:putative thioredoxin